eukprot:762496-Hanusia_phi.AAC.1
MFWRGGEGGRRGREDRSGKVRERKGGQGGGLRKVKNEALMMVMKKRRRIMRSSSTAGSDGAIKIWDWRKGKEVKSLQPKGDVFAASYVDDRNIACAADNIVSLWDLETGKIVRVRKEDYKFGGSLS